MMMVIIYGGITVMEDRKKGVLGRMLVSPLTKTEVFLGKLAGRWLMGLVQALILFVVGQIPPLNLNLGASPWRSLSSPSSPWPWPRSASSSAPSAARRT